MPTLTPLQMEIANASLHTSLFVHGPASCGKTTVGVARLDTLLDRGIPAESILILTPQRTLQQPYLKRLRARLQDAGGTPTLATFGGIARRMCDLFWPLAAEVAGFAHPERPPVFLTLETAQYFMARLTRPLIEEQGLFESVSIDRNRLYAQILDNLNKAAAVGFPYTEIGTRLDAAWHGDPAQRRVYADVQTCATRFRQYCLEHNLLDFSLQLEIFCQILWHEPLVRHYLISSYRHLIYDNLEEDIPRAHDLVSEWLPEFDSALLIYDEGGGYRRFLGADPESAWQLQDLCHTSLELRESFTIPAQVISLAHGLVSVLGGEASLPLPLPATQARAFSFLTARSYPELLDAICDQIQHLVFEEGIPASEIVVLSPYLSDALRFSLMRRLEEAGLPVRSHRPSRSLREEPATQCLLTLAALAHPAWKIQPSEFAVAYAFMLALGMDLVRARLLTKIIYRPNELRLSDFDEIRPETQERITYVFGERYSLLRAWLLEYRAAGPIPLDHFFRRLFGEVLSQPGFGFHDNDDHVRVAASLVESAQKFRQTLSPILEVEASLADLGREYYFLLQEGVIAAQYLEAWDIEESEAILVAPAYTFLMMNRPVRIQFWLDIGSSGWTERLAQPLTHPYVLSRRWMQESPNRVWTDADETNAAKDALTRLVAGLLLRCQQAVYLGLATLGETGFEQRGGLLRAFQKLLQQENAV